MTLSNQALSKQSLSEHAGAQVADLITNALAPRRDSRISKRLAHA